MSRARNKTAPRPAPVKPAKRQKAGGDSWVLRCAPGLSRTLQAELRHRKLLGQKDRMDILWQRNHDLCFIPHLKQAPAPASARLAEEIHRCLIYGRYKITPSQLDRLATALRGRGRRWRLVVTADGAHFDRRDLLRWLGKELGARGLRIDEAAPQTCFVFCVEHAYYACTLESRAEAAPGRAQREAEREGSLPPTVAAAMAFLARPAADDVVLDPVCGSGTLLAEAHALAPEARLHGIDTDPKAVAAARRNLAGSANAAIHHGDARELDLPDASVSLVLANLPFGKQYGDPAENRALYDAILAELRRVAVPSRFRAAILAADAELLAESAKRHGLAVARTIQVRLRGEPATITALQ